MCRFVSLFVVLAVVCPVAVAATAEPSVESFQGLYEGTRTDANSSHKFEARVVALGKGEYKVLIRESGEDGAVTKTELVGQAVKKAVAFGNKANEDVWKGTRGDGTIKGTCGKAGKFEMKRVVRLSPTMGAKPPAGAVVLLDGKNFDEVVAKPGKDGKPQKWQVAKDGGVLIAKGGIRSRRTFGGSFKMHVEFKCPLRADARSQKRGNSGCFMPNGSEVQVLDSFGMTTYLGGGCGGIYKHKNPDAFDEFSLASAPPNQWQTYDIEYTVESTDTKSTGRPVITVFHNGIKIHDKFQLRRRAKADVLKFQDHANPVQYRNVWVLPAK